MWEKNQESVKLAKRITTLLLDIGKDKQFAVEILNALENHIDSCEDFINFLEQGVELVPSEVYEEVSNIQAENLQRNSQMYVKQRTIALIIQHQIIGLHFLKCWLRLT